MILSWCLKDVKIKEMAIVVSWFTGLFFKKGKDVGVTNFECWENLNFNQFCSFFSMSIMKRYCATNSTKKGMKICGGSRIIWKWQVVVAEHSENSFAKYLNNKYYYYYYYYYFSLLKLTYLGWNYKSKFTIDDIVHK